MKNWHSFLLLCLMAILILTLYTFRYEVKISGQGLAQIVIRYDRWTGQASLAGPSHREWQSFPTEAKYERVRLEEGQA